MTYRIYFNRWNEFPLIWSVDDGSQETEMTVSQVILEDVTGQTMSGSGDNVNSPSVWIEATGVLTIAGTVATIRHSAKVRRASRPQATHKRRVVHRTAAVPR